MALTLAQRPRGPRIGCHGCCNFTGHGKAQQHEVQGKVAAIRLGGVGRALTPEVVARGVVAAVVEQVAAAFEPSEPAR